MFIDRVKLMIKIHKGGDGLIFLHENTCPKVAQVCTAAAVKRILNTSSWSIPLAYIIKIIRAKTVKCD